MKANKIVIYVIVPLVLTLIIGHNLNNKYYTFTKSYIAKNHLKSDMIALNLTPNKFEEILIQTSGLEKRNNLRLEAGLFCYTSVCRFMKLFILTDRFIYFDDSQVEFPGVAIRFYFKDLDSLKDIIKFEKTYFEKHFRLVLSSCILNLYKMDFIEGHPFILRENCLLKDEYDIKESVIGIDYRISPYIFYLSIYICLLFLIYNFNFLINEFRKKIS